MMPEQCVGIRGEYITLGQLLKLIGLSDSGGGVKSILESPDITVNGKSESRRGRKLRQGDTVVIDGTLTVRLTTENHS